LLICRFKFKAAETVIQIFLQLAMVGYQKKGSCYILQKEMLIYYFSNHPGSFCSGNYTVNTCDRIKAL